MGQDKLMGYQTMNNSVIEALISGTISSTITTVVYQPLELLKTRMQLEAEGKRNGVVFGRLTKSTLSIAKTRGFTYLWRGTGASLMRSGPGVGLYYALLNTFQTNFSDQSHRPDSATQAFCFGLAARSLISFFLLPITVVKVRYESGCFEYPSLGRAIRSAYINSYGWVGIVPTIVRDSLFSGTYYMCYIGLRIERIDSESDGGPIFLRNFISGLTSGIIASIITNPIDVVKTNVQVAYKQQSVSASQVIKSLSASGYRRFFDGLVPRGIRRTLIAASTWSFYELIIDTLKQRRIN